MQTPSLRWPRSSPWEEVWFAEVSDGDCGLWLRYTLRDSDEPEGALWCIWFGEDGIRARKERIPLGEIRDDREGLHWALARLDRVGARGEAGPMSWGLGFAGSEAQSFTHVPPLLRALGMSGRTYVSACTDLVVNGSVTLWDRTRRLTDARGVLGHIYGARSNASTWAWGHCNRFGRPDVTLEVISAVLSIGDRETPPLASVTLRVGDQHYAFSGVRHLVTSVSSIEEDTCTVTASSGSASLRATFRLPDPSRTARVAYEHASGNKTFCRNSIWSNVSLDFTDRRRGVTLQLESDNASFEIASGRAPVHPLHILDERSRP